MTRRLPIWLGPLCLVAFGLGLLALGIWVEGREAVAAPLVVLGALIVVAGVIVAVWVDIEEMSVTQSGLTFKRRAPSAEELTKAGLPEQVAREITAWMDAVAEVLPGMIDQRVNTILRKRADGARRRHASVRDMVERDYAQRREAGSE